MLKMNKDGYYNFESTNENRSSKDDIAGYEHSFVYSFRVYKKHFFFISFGDVKSNEYPYFSTSGGILNYIRSDYDRCGQCQESVFGKYLGFKKFFRKWNAKHLERLTVAEVEELKQDIEILKDSYDYIEGDSFFEIVQFDRLKSK